MMSGHFYAVYTQYTTKKGTVTLSLIPHISLGGYPTHITFSSYIEPGIKRASETEITLCCYM